MVKLVHQGSAGHTKPECQYNVSFIDLWEFMAFLGKTPDVIPLEIPLLLPIAL
jgi:hypothetical protein